MINLQTLIFIPLYAWFSKRLSTDGTVTISNVTEVTTPILCADVDQLLNKAQSEITYGRTLRYPHLKTQIFETFYESLRRYSVHQYFDYMTFDTDAFQLDKELQSIECDFRETKKHSADITKYLHSMKDLFKAMVKATAFMKRAELSNDHFHKIYAEIYELKVLSMSMFNFKNEPDHSISGYCTRVKLLSARFFSFGEVYSSSIALTPDSLISKISEISIAIERSLKRLTCIQQVRKVSQLLYPARESLGKMNG